jgi:hypothetical protein
VVLIALAAVASVAAADGNKLYFARFSPTSVAGGSSTTFSLTLKNEASTQQLGSVNVTAPAGFTVTAAGPASVASVANGVVQIRNLSLQPGQTRSDITVTASAPCAASTGQWTLVAKQANDFNGPPGNNFALDGPNSSTAVAVSGSCHLAFTGQPADAVKSTAITTTAINTPAGGPVAVSVLDGNNGLVTSSTAAISVSLSPSSPNSGTGAALAGTVTKNAVGGVATFSNLSINVHGTYRLDAKSTGITQATSAAPGFTIWDTATPCTPGQTCDVSVSQVNSQSSQVSGTSTTNGVLVASLGVDAISCGDTFNHAPATTTVNSFSFTANGKLAVVTIDKSIVQQTPNNGVSFYQVCYEGDAPFTPRGGGPQVTLGLLPDCKNVSGAPPCLQSVTKDKAGDVVETLLLPGGDPKYR